MMTNNDSCDNCDNCDNFCNGASPFYIFVRRNNKSYDYNRDCAYDYSWAFGTPPPGMCLFSTEDMEDFDDADTHTSDYIGV